MRRMTSGARVMVLVAALLCALWTPPAAGAASQDDAGSGRDAGNSFEDATAVTPKGYYTGRLNTAAGDRHDFYKFSLPQNGFVSVLIGFSANTIDPITLLDPNGNVVDLGTRVQGTGVT
ncbi:MAG: hypothetical protein M3238_00170, partial [Actinomycetota bacterium]|nr:hypothetical protein [Actinomycetota bacterium]